MYWKGRPLYTIWEVSKEEFTREFIDMGGPCDELYMSI